MPVMYNERFEKDNDVIRLRSGRFRNLFRLGISRRDSIIRESMRRRWFGRSNMTSQP